jgi:hypothetical protein
VEKFEASTTSLIKMTNDFLDVTQFQLGKGVVSLNKSINLSSLLDEIIKDEEFETNKKDYLNLISVDEYVKIFKL